MVYRYIEKAVKLLFVRMCGRGKKTSEVARDTGASDRTVRRVTALHRRTGNVIKQPLIPGRPRKLSALEISFLEGCIDRRPDIYISELQDQLYRHSGVWVSAKTIRRGLRRKGLTYKKVTRRAAERDERDRALFQWVVGTSYRPEQLVFVDETGCDRRTSRRPYAWSYTGDRAAIRESFFRGHKYSILPALSLDGILHCTVCRGSYTSELFNDFIRGLLAEMNPFPGRNSVIVMDNASIHKSTELREMIESRGMRLLFLPTYSPDLNPIEEAFSSIKAWMRRNHQLVSRELSGAPGTNPVQTLLSAVYSVTPAKAKEWYRHANYIM